MKKLLFGLFALTLLATSCKKDKDAPAMTKENIAGTYKMTAEVYKMPAGQGPDEELFSTYEPCFKDNLYKLNLDEVFQVVDAGQVCDPANDLQSTWHVDGNHLIVDDYVLPPCRQAVNDFRTQYRIGEPLEDVDGAAAFWRKASL